MYTFKLVNGDWDFSTSRTGAMINNQDVLLQVQENNLKSIKGSDNYCPDWGSDLELEAGVLTVSEARSRVTYELKQDVLAENARLMSNYRKHPTKFLDSQVPVNLNYVFQTDDDTWQVGIVTLDGKLRTITWQS